MTDIECMQKQFAQIYDEHYTMVYRYFYYKTGSVAHTEDLTAETFLKAYQNFSAFDGKKGGIRMWLMTIAKNAYIDTLRREKFTVYDGELEEDAAVWGEGESADRSVLIAERNRILYKAIGKLNERDRNLIALKYTKDLRNREIAVIIGKTERHTAVLLERALKKLRKILTEMGVTEDGLWEE